MSDYCKKQNKHEKKIGVDERAHMCRANECAVECALRGFV